MSICLEFAWLQNSEGKTLVLQVYTVPAFALANYHVYMVDFPQCLFFRYNIVYSFCYIYLHFAHVNLHLRLIFYVVRQTIKRLCFTGMYLHFFHLRVWELTVCTVLLYCIYHYVHV